MSDTQTVANYLKENFQTYVEDLKNLSRIPSISFPNFDHATIDQSAEFVATLLKRCGLNGVEILKLDGAFPYVYGERIEDPSLPTVLLYAHHDVQPPGRDELWHTKPFDPIISDGPHGKRLYGRGTADDKAGVLIHVSSIEAYLKTIGKLPVNVKVLIEGEEEIGSPHLFEFLQKYQEKIQADYIVLTDTQNYDSGIPSLTVGLRGLVAMEVEVRSLTKAIHSGLWGGPIPDPVMALSKTLASLTDDDGNITVKAIQDKIPPLTEEEKKYFENLPFDEKQFREQSGMVESTHFVQKNIHPLVAIWQYPSLMITAIQASSRQQAGNIINDTAWAKVTVRVPGSMKADEVYKALENHIRKNVPWGLDVSIHKDTSTDGWITDPNSENNKPAFEAAHKALAKGYGKEAVNAGCGATIPFVEPFVKSLKGAPALLVGIEDPYTNAHGENESLLLSDFEKACVSQVYLFEELAKLPKR